MAEDQVLTRHRLVFFAAQHMPLGIERGQHTAGRAVQIVVELALQAAQSVVVGAHVAEHLRAQLRCWDKSA